MSRFPLFAVLSLIGLLAVATAGNVAAGQTDQPSAPARPAGLRVIRGGHSWGTEDSGPLCAAAGIEGHKTMNRPGVHPNQISGVEQYLDSGEIDAYIWQYSGGLPSFVTLLVEKGVAKNPNFRVLVQQPWLVHDGRRDVKVAEEYEDTDLDEYKVTLDKQRAGLEAEVDKINAAAGRRVVFIVPLADAMLEIRKMITGGKFPGITNVNYRDKPGDRGSILQGDSMPHQGLVAMRLGSFMHFATLYKTSPEGLIWPGKNGDGLSDDQRAILQKMAWERVSKYPYAGIAGPPQQEPKPEPTAKPGPAELNTPAGG